MESKTCSLPPSRSDAVRVTIRLSRWLMILTLVVAAQGLACGIARADNPQAWQIEPADLQSQVTTAKAHLGDDPDGGKSLVLEGQARFEKYSLQSHLSEGWWRVSIQLLPNRAAEPDERLEFALWNPHGSAGAFRFTTIIGPAEFGPGGKPVTISRDLHVGPANGNLGMLLHGGWKGLGIRSVRFEPIADPIAIESVRSDRLVYGLREPGNIEVRLLNGGSKVSKARLVIELVAGLGAAVTLHDAEVEIPATGTEPHVVKLPFSPQAEYGHQVRAVLYAAGNSGALIGEARDWFYVSDHPVRIGHLAAWGSDKDYEPKGVDAFVAGMRKRLFPLAEMTFWAPDDYAMLVPPLGKQKWWTGQTLAQLSTATLKARIEALHAQGLRAIGYTDLRLDFGFRVSELFRQHPEWCNWEANDETMGWSPVELSRQMREDDAERFDASTAKPKFGARGVFGPQTGNPQAVDFHISQLVASIGVFGWDGFRYDDAYDYDFAGVDLLGRRVPFKGFLASVLTARLRDALERAKPGFIYGHNMEWVQNYPALVAAGSIGPGETPMAFDTAPAPDDYYTEHVRDDGLHLQERVTAYWGEGTPWREIVSKLDHLGQNAARRGGHAYAITKAHSLAFDGRTMTAVMLASRVHLAYWASDWQTPYLRMAALYCDLLYGESLRPAAKGTLEVQATGGREVWWKQYVRVLEPAAGKRVYLVHLINPPAKSLVDPKNEASPPVARDLDLKWSLPAGWKVEHAWQLTADQGQSLETRVDHDPKVQTVTVSMEQEPACASLATNNVDGRVVVHVGEVVQWSIVSLECSGPTDDRLAEWRFTLPPKPAQPEVFTSETAGPDFKLTGLRPVDFTSSHRFWVGRDPNSKPLSEPRVDDAEAIGGQAVRVEWPLGAETYLKGVDGGRYRFTLRVKAPGPVPNGQGIHLSCWPVGRVWKLNTDFPLDSLVPGKWTDLVYEGDMGSDRGNLGLAIKGGWNGLLIDHLELRELKALTDSERLVEQKITPWPAGLLPAKDGGAWCLLGLWHEFLAVDQGVKSTGMKTTACDWWLYRRQRGWNGPAIKSPEDLAQYRLLVLANVDLRSLTLEQRAWLKGWVEAGGSLFLTGGPYGLGSGGWNESDLIESILPVTLKPFDLRPSEQALMLSTTGPLSALKLPPGAATRWLHDVAPKPGSVVALEAGGKPALVLGEYGKGRVAVLAIAPLGEDFAGAWWRSDAGAKVTQAVCRWLMRMDVSP